MVSDDPHPYCSDGNWMQWVLPPIFVVISHQSRVEFSIPRPPSTSVKPRFLPMFVVWVTGRWFRRFEPSHRFRRRKVRGPGGGMVRNPPAAVVVAVGRSAMVGGRTRVELETSD